MGAGSVSGIGEAVNAATPDELSAVVAKIPADQRARMLAALKPVKVHALPPSMNAMSPVLCAMYAGAGGLEQCDIMSGAQMKPEFLAMNPFHHIPTMSDGDYAIGESKAILRYLAMKYKPELYPVKEPEMCAWIDFAMDSFSDVYEKFKPTVYVALGFKPAGDDQPKANEEFTEIINTWTTHFLKGKFVCGDKLTIADFKVAPFLFAAMQPAVKALIGFQAPDRARQYAEDFCAAVPATSLLKECGGFAVAEFLAGKAKDAPALPDYVKADYAAFPPTPKTEGAGKVKVFGLPPSSNAASPIMLAMDSGAGAMEMCNIMEGAQMTPEFLAMNPFHHIPTMKDGELAIGECCAILRYIALKYKPEYYPVADPAKCGMIDFAMDSFAVDVYDKMKGVVYAAMGFAGPPADQAVANKELNEVVDTWVGHFLKGKFVGGDTLCIADFKAVTFLFASMQPGIETKLGYKASDRVKKYCEDFCAACPSSAFMKEAGGFAIAEYVAQKCA